MYKYIPHDDTQHDDMQHDDMQTILDVIQRPPRTAAHRVASRLSLCFSLALFFASIATAQTARPVAPQDDTQSWNDVQVAVPINKKVDLFINGQVRFGDRLTEFVDERAGGGISIKAGKYLTFTPSYLYIATQQPETRRRAYENRLNFAATIRFPQLEKMTITDRNLVERRLLNSRPDATRYRNRLQVERPFKFGGLGTVRLFIADEVFYDGAVRAWTRNRFSVGGGRALNKSTNFDIYYLRQNDGRSRPGDLHVIGTSLRFRL